MMLKVSRERKVTVSKDAVDRHDIHQLTVKQFDMQEELSPKGMSSASEHDRSVFDDVGTRFSGNRRTMSDICNRNEQ